MEIKTIWVGEGVDIGNCILQFPHEPHRQADGSFCGGVQGLAYSKRWRLCATLHITPIEKDGVIRGFHISYHSKPYVTSGNVKRFLQDLGWKVEGKKWLTIEIAYPNGEKESVWMRAQSAASEFYNTIASRHPDIGCWQLFEHLRKNGDDWRVF